MFWFCSVPSQPTPSPQGIAVLGKDTFETVKALPTGLPLKQWKIKVLML